MQTRAIRHIGLLALIVAVIFGMTAMPGIAQTSQGTILGTLTDSTGAVVAKADIQLINSGTGTKIVAKTNDSGYYQFVEVPVGTYSIVVQQKGFKKLSRPGITLETGARIQVDLALTVGAETETVEVSASSPLIEADNVSLGTVVDTRETNELPLNGRNPMNLTALVASVIPLGQTQGSPTGVNPIAWGNYQIGGGMAGQNNVFLDGAPDWGVYDHNIEVIPSQDSIAEFRVETNNLSAEYGRLAGGAIQFTTKSGSKDIHGSAYEFLRNKIFNANTWWANHGGASRPAFTQNQYGFNVGGPVFIPHVYDGRKKTFFFFNWEGFALRQGETYTENVPDSNARGGDINDYLTNASVTAAQIYDPLSTCGGIGASPACTGAQARGDRTPLVWGKGAGKFYVPGDTGYGTNSQSVNPTTFAYMGYVFPTATSSGVSRNYVLNASGGGNNYQSVVKIDHDLSAKNHIAARYTEWYNNSLAVDVFKPVNSGICGNGACAETYYVHNFVLDDTATLSAKSILDLRLSFGRYKYNRTPLNSGFDVTKINWPAEYGSLVEFPGPASFSVPQWDQGSYTPFGGQGSDSTIVEAEDTYRLAGTFTKFWGNHTVKAGGEYTYQLFNYAQTNVSAGLWYWTSGWTQSSAVNAPTGGLDVASYMLGYDNSGSEQFSARIASKDIYPALFVTDDWRASSKLTFHVGARWENNLPFTERHNYISSFDPTATNDVLKADGITALGNTEMANTPARTSRYAKDPYNMQFSPRVGLSYRVAANTVVTAGYGVFWLPNDVALAANPGWDGDGSQNTNTKTTIDSVSPFGCSTPTGICNISYPWPMTNSHDATTSYIIAPAFRTTTNGTSNLPAPLYNGAGNAIALPSSVYLYQLNTIGNGPTQMFPKDPWAYAQQWNIGVQQQLGKTTAIDVSYAGSRGVHLPFGWLGMDNMPDSYLALGTPALQAQVTNPYAAVIPAANSLGKGTIDYGQSLKPYPEYSGMSEPADLGDSKYQAMEVKVTKRFAQGASINVAYTLAKFQSNTDTLNTWLESVSGLQDNNNLKGEMSLSSDDTPQRLVVAYVYDVPVGRGKAFLPNISRAADLAIGGWGLQGMTTLMKGFPLGLSQNGGQVYGQGQRPNVVAGCNKKVSGGADQKALHGWFNPACFTDPGQDVYGNEPRLDPSLEAAGMANWDLSVVKKFNVSPEGKINMQFRAEFFNLFNRTQFDVPNTSIPGANGRATNPNVGLVSAQLNLPRLVQFALRLNF